MIATAVITLGAGILTLLLRGLSSSGGQLWGREGMYQLYRHTFIPSSSDVHCSLLIRDDLIQAS